MTKTFTAEVIGTFILVFFGCGAVVFMAEHIGMMGIAFTFGLALIAAAYSVGNISGAHLNPAVSLGMLVAGKMDVATFISYVIAQVIGAILAAGAVLMIANGNADYSIATNGLATSGYGDYNATSAFLFEAIATFLFVTVILGATQSKAPAAMAGLAIGLTLVAIHLAGIAVSGASVNPARSFGPALFAGSAALGQVWLYIAAPLLGGAIAGIVFKMGLTSAEEA